MKKPQGLPEQWEVQELCVPEKGWIRSYVDCYKGKVEVPSEAIAGTAYTLLSAIVGWKALVETNESLEFSALSAVSRMHSTTVPARPVHEFGVWCRQTRSC